ncbi:endonuclease/exonuclease/phosphatase family protein [Gramella lutea]|uniref:Endonuclease/exonuclease/phosphatase family protein n=1 Tax=Christiangramia lutea TaxID=1607951 RepID=A0A9X1V233_9FLAO|nr:endonuclease/exonuclease/phosphatase family protein [Christiangramia lutea]
MSNKVYCQNIRNYQIETVAFYNVENLFDTLDDTLTFDDDRTALGKDNWTEERYHRKIENIARVLSEIGRSESGNSPLIIGLCEIENIKVLKDLVSHPYLKEKNYGIIHYDSPDERGIDVALLYRKEGFIPLNSHSRKLMIFDADKRDYTRDQLVVSGTIHGEDVHFIVNHWPSRSGGEAKSSYKREKAALLNRKIIDSLYREDQDAKIIGMGDFNDDPINKSFKTFLQTRAEIKELKEKELYNPMENMLKNGKGTLAYRDSWNLFDQFYLSQSLVSRNFDGFQFYKAGIFNPPYVITQTGQFRGYPFRTYGSTGYEPGFSDHFAIYLYLIREVN